MIHIDGTELIAQLDEHGWAQGVWTASDGAICAHQAIRLCAPQPGDAHLIEAVATAQGWGPTGTTTPRQLKPTYGHASPAAST